MVELIHIFPGFVLGKEKIREKLSHELEQMFSNVTAPLSKKVLNIFCFWGSARVCF